MKYSAIRCIGAGKLTRDKLGFIVSQIDIGPERTEIEGEIEGGPAESCQRIRLKGPKDGAKMGQQNARPLCNLGNNSFT